MDYSDNYNKYISRSRWCPTDVREVRYVREQPSSPPNGRLASPETWCVCERPPSSVDSRVSVDRRHAVGLSGDRRWDSRAIEGTSRTRVLTVAAVLSATVVALCRRVNALCRRVNAHPSRRSIQPGGSDDRRRVEHHYPVFTGNPVCGAEAERDSRIWSWRSSTTNLTGNAVCFTGNPVCERVSMGSRVGVDTRVCRTSVSRCRPRRDAFHRKPGVSPATNASDFLRNRAVFGGTFTGNAVCSRPFEHGRPRSRSESAAARRRSQTVLTCTP